MTRIAELPVAELTRHAFQVFVASGRHPVAARLVHHALSLDPWDPQALRCLSDYLDESGLEYLSALVLEHALAADSPLAAADRKMLDDARFVAMWTWGFSRHESGAADLDAREFDDRSRFAVEQDRYRDFLAKALQQLGSLPQAYRAALTLVGALGGLLIHEQKGEDALFEELLHPERFRRTPAYDEWLASDDSALAEFERPREPGENGASDPGPGAS